MITCPYCSEDTGIIDDGFHCSTCGRSEDGPTAADDYVENVMGISQHKAVQDGGDWPITPCGECGRDSFVDFGPPEDMNVVLRALCFQCGREIANSEPDMEGGGPRNCLICGVLFETTGGMTVCPDCFVDSFAKD